MTVPQATSASRPANARTWLRWLAVSIFVLSSALNYLDRQLLAVLAPTLKLEFHLTNEQFGQVIALFSIVYAVMAPVSGWLVDRIGVNLGITLSMGLWSLAGIATGFVRSFGGLLSARVALAVGEAAGIPSTGKVNGVYLAPGELAFGTALNQVGITLGLSAAPLIVAAMTPVYGWQSVFVVCGALGFAWIPLWWLIARHVPAINSAPSTSRGSVSDVLKDKRLWGLAAANALAMTPYTLWTNWTTIYFVQQHHLTQNEANARFVWIPPIFAMLGGFAGAWLALRGIRTTHDVVRTRLRICLWAALVLLFTAAVPLAHEPWLAAILISVSAFACLASSTNIYAMPIDFFGVRHAAFGVSILTCSYGLMQTLISPLIGGFIDDFGFGGVCLAIAILPLAGIAILRWSAVSEK